MANDLYGFSKEEFINLVTEVRELPTSRRLTNACRRAGMMWVWQLAQLDEAELVDEGPKRFGPRSIKEIKEEILGPLGLSLNRVFTPEQVTFLEGYCNPAGTA